MDHKRRKLDDIEDAVMKEDDPENLATLYERFRKEYEEYLMKKADKERKRYQEEEAGRC